MFEKRCCKCGATKHPSEFPKDRTKKDGLHKRCKECDRKVSAAWYAANGAQKRAHSRQWKKANRDKVNKQVLRRQERERLAPGGPFDTRRRDYYERYKMYGGFCAYCRQRKAQTFDHGIPLSKGGGNWAANIYPVCDSCNLRKGAKKLYSEWHPSRTSSPLPLP